MQDESKLSNAYYDDGYAYWDHKYNFLYKMISMESEEIYEIYKALREDGALDPQVRNTLMNTLRHEKRELARLMRLIESLDPDLGGDMGRRPCDGYYDRYQKE